MTDAESLTTGWEVGLDPSDTLCRAYLEHWVTECEIFARAAPGGDATIERNEAFALADHRRPTELFNTATLVAPPGPSDWDALLTEIEGRFAGGTGRVYLWSLWPTPDLRDRGWELEGHPPLLVRPPVTAVACPEPDGELTPVTDRATLADWERAVVDGFPMGELQPFRPGRLAGPGLLGDDRLRLWVGYADGEPASASAFLDAAGLSGLALATTLPAARHRGHWRRHARTRLHARPDQWAVGVFSDMSRPGAEQHGFVPILRFTLWHRDR